MRRTVSLMKEQMREQRRAVKQMLIDKQMYGPPTTNINDKENSEDAVGTETEAVTGERSAYASRLTLLLCCIYL